MNRICIKLSLLFLCSLPFINGCGPQDVNDADYLAQLADIDSIGNSLNKNVQTGESDQASESDDEAGRPETRPDAKPEGCPVGGNCPSGNCETPGDPDTMKTVQLPDQTVTEPTKVTHTKEEQLATDTVDYRTTKQWDPLESTCRHASLSIL